MSTLTNKEKGIAILVVSAIVIIVLGIGGYFLWKYMKGSQKIPSKPHIVPPLSPPSSGGASHLDHPKTVSQAYCFLDGFSANNRQINFKILNGVLRYNNSNIFTPQSNPGSDPYNHYNKTTVTSLPVVYKNTVRIPVDIENNGRHDIFINYNNKTFKYLNPIDKIDYTKVVQPIGPYGSNSYDETGTCIP